MVRFKIKKFLTSNLKNVLARIFFLTCILQLSSGISYSQAIKSTNKSDASFFLERVLNDTSDFYYVDFSNLDNNISTTSPVGVFDSGTGGLTVLDAILDFDNFDTTIKSYHINGDGIKDFENESFIYFGDQANMPYGNYAGMGKTAFLKELILRDALFLLGNKSYNTAFDTTWHNEKEPVKLIVIACNTATAYGKEDIENMLAEVNNNTKVIGVIDAGVRGALTTFGENENGTAAVMATAGTVSSDGYLNSFFAEKSKLGFTGNFEFLQQSGIGIAEAIDEEPSFIDRTAKQIRENYQGPSMTSQSWKIKEELLPVYNFDTTGNALLFEKTNGKYSEIQLNSAENYIRYHLVNLCEQLKSKPVAKPLKTLILGCTHYPYYSDFFQETLNELYHLKINGEYVYKDVLNDSILLIDPALNTAKEVHEYLNENKLLNMNNKVQSNQFYISVPDLSQIKIETESSQNFTYRYKYSRDVNHFYDTKQVPMSKQTVNEEVLKRIELQMPDIFDMIMKFELEKYY